jgi:transcriptional regulator with XRE-family HTH domain
VALDNRLTDVAGRLDRSLLAQQIQAKRDQDGLTLRDAAQQSGVSYSTLSRLERAAAHPDVETLNHVLAWLGLPFSRLVPGSEPVRAHLRAPRNLVPGVAAALAEVAQSAQAHSNAERHASGEGSVREALRPYRPMGASTREARAINFRRAIGWALDEPLNPFALEVTGVRTLYLNDIPGISEETHRILVGSGKSLWSAMTLPTNDDESAWLIVLNPTHAIERQRATLMEELCHILLGHQLTTLSHLEGQTFRDYDKDQEKDAYGLGTAILVPRNPLLRRIGRGDPVEVIAHHFGVSQPLIEYRIKVTGAWYQYKLRQHVKAKP